MAMRVPGNVKRLTLAATILGSGIVLLDSTIVNVALPTIQRNLGGGLAAPQWVAKAYVLTLGSLILIGGSLGGIFGERRGCAGAGGRGLRAGAAAGRGGAGGGVPGGGWGAGGCRGRAAAAGRARRDRLDLPTQRARPGDRVVDGVGRDRHGDRAAR